MAGLYLHIPFCRQACHYCDFHFSTTRDNVDALVTALCVEIELQKNYLGDESIETIYFGGGTPSLLYEHHLQKIFAAIRAHLNVAPVEVTLEANPDDLSPAQLAVLQKAGVNRLSIGIQSFDDKILKFLNRAHAAADARKSLDDARAAGFDNISLDLIYAIPGQSEAQLKKNIATALSFSPEHISAYSLTIEEKTVFGKWASKGTLTPDTDDVAAAQMEVVVEQLIQAGYEHYEISNFCKPGFFSKHNSSYWQQKKYLGIGPSAHSFDINSRQYNISNNAIYIRSINDGKIPCEKETLTQQNKINEYIFTTLRTKWGCSLNHLRENFHYDLQMEQAKNLAQLTAQGVLQIDNDVLTLTAKGKLLADKISTDLFVDDHN